MEHTIEGQLRTAERRLLEARKATLAGLGSAAHHVEPVAIIDGVRYINDSASTFLDATLATLRVLAANDPAAGVLWITGIWNTGLFHEPLIGPVCERLNTVLLIGELPQGCEPSQHVRFFQVDELRTATFLARELARPGDVVLFSPACPSGNGFANYAERGTEFKRAVGDL